MRIEDLETPAVVIDLDKVEANLARAQAFADARGLALRPHVKTHKLPRFARRQVELGAVGITCQKLGEAEVMSEGGLQDILISYNILGAPKLDRLRRLRTRAEVTVCADNAQTIEGYAATFADAGKPLKVMIECETGAGRCGVQSPAEARALAKAITAAPGLVFHGLMTYPPRGAVDEVDRRLAEIVAALGEAGIQTPVVSNGGTPDFLAARAEGPATEHRPGTYIYSDRMQVGFGHGALEDCALIVLATVISRPTAERAVLDTGSKALAADLAAASGHGHILEYPDAVIGSLSEEHGVVDLSASTAKPEIGERVRVIPNHVCVVSNLFDTVYMAKAGEIAAEERVAARGRMT